MLNYKIDLFSIFIFLGIVQAVFLSVFFLFNENRKNKTNLFTGLLLITIAASSFEILLMYTGYIVHCLHLVDFSEPFAFLIGPFVFLITITYTRETLPRLYWLHFIFAGAYLILLIPFLIAPEEVKYNAWIESYDLALPFRPYDYEAHNPRKLWLTDQHTALTLVSLLLYAALTLKEVFHFFRVNNVNFLKPSGEPFKKLQAIVVQVCFVTLLILIVKAFNPNDTGDHMFTAYLSLLIYMISFHVMRSSGFFKSPVEREKIKVKPHAVSSEEQNELVRRIRTIMENEKPYLNSDFSLPELARLTNTTVHGLSQVINTVIGKSFFELTASYRVEEAKQLLVRLHNVKVEEIAEMVGYSSRSSFNTVFKKLAGVTPSQYRDKELANTQ